METIFEKPLDKQVAENTDHIATLTDHIGNYPIAYYQDVTIGNVTLNATGYYDISSFKPSGKTISLASVATWSSMSPNACFTVTADGTYIIGAANQSIIGLKVRFYY